MESEAFTLSLEYTGKGRVLRASCTLPVEVVAAGRQDVFETALTRLRMQIAEARKTGDGNESGHLQE